MWGVSTVNRSVASEVNAKRSIPVCTTASSGPPCVLGPTWDMDGPARPCGVTSLTLPTLLRWEARLLKQQQEVSVGDDTSPGGQGVPLEEIQEQEEC